MSTLTVHAGGVRRTRESLRDLPTPARTATWTPVPHADLVEELIGSLTNHGLNVVQEQYATLGRDHAKLFGVIDLQCPTFDTDAFGLSLGLRTSNDKSMALAAIAAAHVFVCDNMAFSGYGGVKVGGDGANEDASFLRAKHTARLDISKAIPEAVDRYMEQSNQFRLDLARMQEIEIKDSRAKGLIHDAFVADKVMPIRLLPEVSRLYFDDEDQKAKFPDRTLWSLNNAMTEAVKNLKATSSFKSGQRVGRYFGKALRKSIREAVPSVN